MRGGEINENISSKKLIFTEDLVNISKTRKDSAATAAYSSLTAIAIPKSDDFTKSKNLLINQHLDLQLKLNIKDTKLPYPWKDQKIVSDKCVLDNDVITIANGRDYKKYIDQEDRRNVVNTSVPMEQRVETVNKSDTVTTVPQLQQKLNKLKIKSNSLIAPAKQKQSTLVKSLSDNSTSAPLYPQTALDKFNQIIDETMSGTNEYPVQQSSESVNTHIRNLPLLSDNLKYRLAQHYPNFMTNNSNNNFNTFSNKIVSDKIDANIEQNADLSDLKHKDVNYLLKQFNSFSDIEKVELLDKTKKESKYEILFNAQYRSASKPHGIREKHNQLQSPVKRQMLNNNYENDILVSSKSQPLARISDKLHSSPTATSLILYSPSAQSHKRIRRYASLQQSKELSQPETLPYQHIEDHYYHHHQHQENHYNAAPVRACIAHVANVAMLQQFVDEYMFQSCHYLEMNNFTSNYRTAMVESSSHEFRPSITTNTNTSDIDGGIGYENSSLNQSFEINEVKTSSTPYKSHATVRSPVLLPREEYPNEKRTYAKGVQTDFAALPLSQNSTWSSSGKSSPSSTTEYKPLFKCCYTPLDKWCKKRTKNNNHFKGGTPLKAPITQKHQKPS